MDQIRKLIDELRHLTIACHNTDFLLTWDKTVDELKAHLLVADILKLLRQNGISPRIFDSGLAISIFRDHSTRTRFSYASAANLLGLAITAFDEKVSQVAHGETVRETANMVSFMADIIGIRDDMYIGKGHTYMTTVSGAVQQGHEEGVLEQRPTLVNLQCDIDHPTQSMSDFNHLVHHFGGVENLRGKKIAMSWAYSPSYGKPLSVPQGVIGLLTRFGMNVVLAHPEGYELMPDVVERAGRQAEESGGSFTVVNDMREAFVDCDVVYPKSWAPFGAMKKRTDFFGAGDMDGIKALEQELLAQNAEHKDWQCTEEMMAVTKDALYLHCLPADISGVSCETGEVAETVFNKFRVPMYKEAGWKPYIIAAMMFLQKCENPADVLAALLGRPKKRFLW